MENDLKVLLVAPMIPPIGGMSTFTKSLLDEFTNTDIVDIIVVDTAVRWRSVWHNSPVIRFFGGTLQAIKIIFSAFFIILSKSPHVLHVCSTAGPGSLRDIIIIQFAQIMRIPSIIQYHTGRLIYDMKDNSIDWKLALNAMSLSKTIAVFTKVELDCITKFLPEKNVIIIPNMIDLAEVDNLIKCSKYDLSII